MLARHTLVAIDLGTGDGRAVIERARHEPRTLVIGVDANAAAMAETSRRAARRSAKGGIPNALFVVASAERPPAELTGRADRLDIVLPWGSLLLGTLALDVAAARGIAALVRPGGTAVAYVSITERDAVDVAPLHEDSCPEVAARWSAFGLCVVGFRRAAVDEIVATGSTWGKRLSADPDRPVWRLEIRRPARDESVADAI